MVQKKCEISKIIFQSLKQAPQIASVAHNNNKLYISAVLVSSFTELNTNYLSK